MDLGSLVSFVAVSPPALAAASLPLGSQAVWLLSNSVPQTHHAQVLFPTKGRCSSWDGEALLKPWDLGDPYNHLFNTLEFRRNSPSQLRNAQGQTLQPAVFAATLWTPLFGV